MREVPRDEAALATGEDVLWAAFHELHYADPMCLLPQPWLRIEIINSYQMDYGQYIPEVHIPVQKVTVVPQESGD